MGTGLSEMLKHHLAHRGWGFKKLAQATGLPERTVDNWTNGRVAKVRNWRDLASIAGALELDRLQANALLEAGGHPSVSVLLERATTGEDRELLSRWALDPASNLPNQLTSFVGRGEDLERIARLLASARLVTLTGPGGSGKTRLALEAARAALDAFDGVHLVDLAALRDPDEVILVISQSLGLGESRDEPPLAALVTHLQDRSLLLVLDNFEQVIEAAPLVADLLWSTRRVTALVTSRTRLNVRGEHEVVVPPLPLPDSTRGFKELARNPAVVLFADRARIVDAAFTISPANARLVADICVHLEGLPLAIELAAARTRQVGLRAMLDHFPSRLALASGGPRDVAHRQRTLRATIGWSYDLLTPAEQMAFNRLGVFAGGFTRDAAVAVCASTGAATVDASVVLDSFVDQSLLGRVLDAQDEPRYEMLETIREFALERLATSGKTHAARSAHVHYFVALAERADLEGAGQASWLPRLAVEHDNFRAALDWCRGQGHPETGLRLSLALMRLWQLQDHQLEARAWLETFMAAKGTAPIDMQARVLLWQGALLMRGMDDAVPSVRFFDEALVLFRREGNLSGASEALQAVGDVFRQQGEWGRAEPQYVESLKLAKRAGNAYLAAYAYMGLALCAQEEAGLAAAQAYWEQTLVWAERSGNQGCIALTLNGLGEMARGRGDVQEARRCYGETLDVARELGSDFRTALALHNLGYIELSDGNPRQAKDLFSQSLMLYRKQHYRKGQAECLAGLGKVEASDGRLERAARLCGASEAILKDLRTLLDTPDRNDFERTLASLSSRLGERLEPLLDEGRAMSAAEAVEYAVSDR